MVSKSFNVLRTRTRTGPHGTARGRTGPHGTARDRTGPHAYREKTRVARREIFVLKSVLFAFFLKSDFFEQFWRLVFEDELFFRNLR